MLLFCHKLYVCTVYIAVLRVAVYNSVQSEEEYYLIWKAKPPTFKLANVNGKKIDKKKIKK